MPRVEPGVPEGDDWQLKVKPGLSTFANNPQDLGPYLDPLLDRALELIPPNKLASTPIFLLATAGMRLLPAEQQQSILSETCRHLRRNYTFDLPDCSQNIRIISGEEEGIFGWTAVNYLLDGFDSHTKSDQRLAAADAHHHHHGGRDSSTFGFLDLGGASAQIAFEPSPEERLKHDNDLEQVVLRLLDGRTLSHPVFVTTWLGYGTNQARDRYIQQLASAAAHSSSSDQGTLPDPCLPKDLVLASDPHTTLRGTGDFAACIKTLSPLLNKEAPCPDQPCLFAGVHAPAIDFAVNHFIGISEYWYSTNEIFQLGGIYDFVEFEKAALDYCATDWDDIVATRRSGVDLSRLQMQCFKAAWLVNILHEGIGIPRITDKGGKGDGQKLLHSALEKGGDKGFVQDEASQEDRPAYFQSVDHVNNVAVSWTLGKMVLEVSASIPERDVETLAERPAWLPQIDFDLHDLEQIRPRLNTLTNPHPSLLFSLLFVLLLLFFCLVKRRSFSAFKYFSPARRRRQLASDTFDLEALEAGESVSSPLAKQRASDASKTLGGTLRRWGRRLSISLGSSSARLGLPQHLQVNANGSHPRAAPGPSALTMRPKGLRHAASSPNLNTRKPSSDPLRSQRGAPPAPPSGVPPPPAIDRSDPFLNGGGSQEGALTNLDDAGAGLERSVTPLSRFGRTSSVRPPSRSSSATSLANGFYARRGRDTTTSSSSNTYSTAAGAGAQGGMGGSSNLRPDDPF